jgi:hypothetical protein
MSHFNITFTGIDLIPFNGVESDDAIPVLFAGTTTSTLESRVLQ